MFFFFFLFCDTEVALEKPYNEKCDVYSFCILLWEILSLKRPFELYTIKLLKKRVYGEECKRPFVQESWTAPIKRLLKRGWANNPEERYTMKQVEEILRKESVRVRDGIEDGLEHQRRRSTFVFRPGAEGRQKVDLAALNVGPTKTARNVPPVQLEDESLHVEDLKKNVRPAPLIDYKFSDDDSFQGDSVASADKNRSPKRMEETLARLEQSAPAMIEVPDSPVKRFEKAVSSTSVTEMITEEPVMEDTEEIMKEDMVMTKPTVYELPDNEVEC